jgi:hypothetical protein
MIRAKPDVIVTSGAEPQLQAVMPLSGLIPIVFWANNFDPIERGYVKRRPSRPSASIQNDSGLPQGPGSCPSGILIARGHGGSEAEEPCYERANHKGWADPGIGHHGASGSILILLVLLLWAYLPA